MESEFITRPAPLRGQSEPLVLIYRFRFRSGQSAIERDHQFRDDLDALDAAIVQSDTSDVEIWQAGKLIERVKKGNAPLTEKDRVSG